MRVTTVFIVVQGLSTSQLENLLKTLEERLTGLAFRNTKRGINALVSSLSIEATSPQSSLNTYQAYP
ncbi:TPA: hypothetical protein ACX6Q1_003307 [Photobacterium damselae]